MEARLTGSIARLAGALALVALVAGSVGCAELAEPSEIGAHPEGWAESESADFHGTFVRQSAFANKVTSCVTCHGGDFTGGTSGVSCSSSGCHDAFPHPEAEWMAPAAEDFHGKVTLRAETNAQSCAPCHGAEYDGGWTEVGCFTCHNQYPHDPVFGGAPRATHDTYMREVANWDLSTCTTCHGSNYAGGEHFADEKTCLTCHAQADGPENCSTCHGGDATGMPPPDLFGSTATTSPGVGAHAAHTAAQVACVECHVVPDAYGSEGHLGGDKVVFGPLATRAGALVAAYDPVANTCGSTYCHGSFSFAKADAGPGGAFAYSADSIEGNNPVVSWVDVGSGQAECGTCHGLPPTGHINVPTCSLCHGSVVDGDNNIIDPSKHGNGQVDR